MLLVCPAAPPYVAAFIDRVFRCGNGLNRIEPWRRSILGRVETGVFLENTAYIFCAMDGEWEQWSDKMICFFLRQKVF